MRKIKTFTAGNIVGCLRIVNGLGYLGYMYLEHQDPIDLYVEENLDFCKNIMEQASQYCIKYDCKLVSY